MSTRRKLLVGVLLLVAAAVGGVFLYQHLSRMGVAADVRQYTPADAEALLYIPQLDQSTHALVQFTRGVQEAARLRELLKPETGVDLGDSEGLRNIGVDPEAGLVLFTRAGMLHILFAVEDADALAKALEAKFVNLGFPPIERSEPDAAGVVMHEVVDAEGQTYASFAANDGLMVLVYKNSGADPEAGVRSVLASDGERFFDSAQYASVVEQLGSEGPLLFAAGDRIARGADGAPRAGFLDRLALPPVIDAFVRPRVTGYLNRVRYLAARLDIQPCATTMHATLKVDQGEPLLPPTWLPPASPPAPDLGKLLPRDTVLFLRTGVNAGALGQLAKTMTQGLSNLGNLIGLGGEKFDPLAGVLGGQIHPDLGDKHILRDLVDHLTGHLGVALVGFDRSARVADIANPPSAEAWLSQVQVVLMFQLRDPEGFWNKWWAERPLLAKLGFESEQLVHPRWKVLRAQRNCKPDPQQKGEPPPCEHYGVMLLGDVLMVTTGADTPERIVQAAGAQAGALHGLTREPMALEVLEHGSMLLGGYFSFDGLLKAIANRNLPGGATRYLAQMYELAFSLDLTESGAKSRLLLTR